MDLHRWDVPTVAFQRYPMLNMPAGHFLSQSILHCISWSWGHFCSILLSFEGTKENKCFRCFSPEISHFYSNNQILALTFPYLYIRHYSHFLGGHTRLSTAFPIYLHPQVDSSQLVVNLELRLCWSRGLLSQLVTSRVTATLLSVRADFEWIRKFWTSRKIFRAVTAVTYLRKYCT